MGYAPRMHDADALFETLRRAADPDAARAIESLVRDGPDEELARVNAIGFAAGRGLDEEKVIAALLQASRLGLFEMSWNILCPSCGGVLDANATLKSVRQEDYHCAFCGVTNEPTLDDTVEVSFTVSPRIRRIAAHEPDGLGFWDYYRQVFFGSGVAYPEPGDFDELSRKAMLEAVELQAGERAILALQLPAGLLIVFDPVTHTAHFVEAAGEPPRERQELAVIFSSARAPVGRTAMHPGPLRLLLDNRTQGRVLPGVFVTGPELDELLGGRRPFLTAKRLLTNQTFRDLYRTDTLDVDQRLKIMSLTFLFTDLKGSTELYERVGDLVAYDMVRAHFQILNEIVASESGAVVKTIGDAVMATFPVPHRAVSAALRMREFHAAAERAAGRGRPDPEDRDPRGSVPRREPQRSPGLLRPDGQHRVARAGAGHGRQHLRHPGDRPACGLGLAPVVARRGGETAETDPAGHRRPHAGLRDDLTWPAASHKRNHERPCLSGGVAPRGAENDRIRGDLGSCSGHRHQPPAHRLNDRKVRTAAIVAAGCSSMSRPALAITASVTSLAVFRITIASFAPKGLLATDSQHRHGELRGHRGLVVFCILANGAELGEGRVHGAGPGRSGWACSQVAMARMNSSVPAPTACTRIRQTC